MSKVLLVYNQFNRYGNSELNDIITLLKKRLDEVGFHNCTIKVEDKEQDGFDMIAGYHLETDLELSLSAKYGGNYLHFFDSHHMFDFASVRKTDEIAGYKMYTIAPIQPPSCVVD